MPDNKKYIFAKFKIDSSSDHMDAAFCSEDMDRVRAWKGDNEKDKTSEPLENSDELQTEIFPAMIDDFDKSMSIFRDAIPFVMRTTPYIKWTMDDVRLRGFAKDNGELLEKDSEYELYRLGIENIGKIGKIFSNMKVIRSGINAMPNMFLIGLVSSYDAFLSGLLKNYFITVPEAISSSEKNISFKELITFGSIDAARDRMIEKEVESLMRKSHAEHFDWLELRLGIPLRKNLSIWPSFIEICERRNLHTHTGGIVSSQYLDVCKAHRFDTGSIKVGDKLEVNARYFKKSVAVIMELGIKLSHVVWRKLLPNDTEKSAERLDSFCYNLISTSNYILASELLNFGINGMPSNKISDYTRKSMVVNYANAEKLSGNTQKSVAILDKEDWSSTGIIFKLCVAAVRDENDAVIGMMRSASNDDSIKASCFQEWPVFKNLRKDPLFIEEFEKIYGEKMLVSQETKRDMSKEPSASFGKDVVDVSEEIPGPKTVH